MKIFLLFYMCHFAIGLTHCYKTTVFFYTFYGLIGACTEKPPGLGVELRTARGLCDLPLRHEGRLIASTLRSIKNATVFHFAAVSTNVDQSL